MKLTKKPQIIGPVDNHIDAIPNVFILPYNMRDYTILMQYLFDQELKNTTFGFSITVDTRTLELMKRDLFEKI